MPVKTESRYSASAKKVASPGQDYELWALLEQACHMAVETRERELIRLGITGVQAAVLFAIEAIGDKATPAEISRWTLRESQSTSAILDRMEKAGLVVKAKDLERKNMVRIAMTEKGERAYRESMKRKSSQKLLSPLSETERQELRSYLERVRNKALRLLGVAYKPPFP
jgi:DNA-binding MarR family transcriptional regulator